MLRTLVRLTVIAAPITFAAPAIDVGAQDNGQLKPTAAVQVTGKSNAVRNYSSPLIARNPKNGQLAIAERRHPGHARVRRPLFE